MEGNSVASRANGKITLIIVIYLYAVKKKVLIYKSNKHREIKKYNCTAPPSKKHL